MNVLAALIKTVEIDCDVHRAFEVFTSGIDGWWPVAGHSLGEDEVERVEFEPRLGGRVFERWHDGTECSWGEVSVWEPPHRVVFSWLPNPENGRSTEVEVTFRAGGTGSIVTLEHRGWERNADEEARRHNYDTGWDRLLALYARSATL